MNRHEKVGYSSSLHILSTFYARLHHGHNFGPLFLRLELQLTQANHPNSVWNIRDYPVKSKICQRRISDNLMMSHKYADITHSHNIQCRCSGGWYGVEKSILKVLYIFSFQTYRRHLIAGSYLRPVIFTSAY